MQGTPQPLNEHKFKKYPPEETFYAKKTATTILADVHKAQTENLETSSGRKF